MFFAITGSSGLTPSRLSDERNSFEEKEEEVLPRAFPGSDISTDNPLFEAEPDVGSSANHALRSPVTPRALFQVTSKFVEVAQQEEDTPDASRAGDCPAMLLLSCKFCRIHD